MSNEPSVFSRIMSGELPGRFVWEDETAVSFLTIAPITWGHLLVVPRAQVDRWTDLDEPTWAHLSGLAHRLGRALEQASGGKRVGSLIAGLEVPHVHIHLIAFEHESELSFARANPNTPAEELDMAADCIREAIASQRSNSS